MSNDDLSSIYRTRFAGLSQYRTSVWKVLIKEFFLPMIPDAQKVLDLGSGYGEFINNLPVRERYAMDLNPDSCAILSPDITFFQQDCSKAWPLPDSTLDAVFTSNFFEHLPSKESLASTLAQAFRCLRPGGVLIAMGPNIRYLPGSYWDFWDHYLPLTHLTLAEGARIAGFEMDRVCPRFLPYTMADGRQYPLALLRLYLRLSFVWPLFGKQFLVIARKPST